MKKHLWCVCVWKELVAACAWRPTNCMHTTASWESQIWSVCILTHGPSFFRDKYGYILVGKYKYGTGYEIQDLPIP